MKKPTSRIVFILLFIFFSHGVVLAQPANDNCANAKVISTDSACITGTSLYLGETLTAATNQAYTLTSSCSQLATARDVWYRFVAKTKYPTITISNQGTGWGGIGNVRVQLFSGTCGSFTEKACGTGATLTLALTNPLTEGATYYIRIHKNTATAIGTNHTFDICVTDPLTDGGRMNEVFARTILSAAGVLNYPWEITYGPDSSLWITESRGYRVYRMDPNTGVKTMVLNLSSGSTFLPPPSDSLNAVSMGSWSPWPQGGLAGLAIHPRFMDASGQYKYVYVTYVHRSLGGTSPSGLFYRNKLVRFTYNTGTGLLELPAVICDTLPGSKDHNSQRMIIAPMTQSGTDYYLFFASGDMGSGQFENRTRTMRAQIPASYEGKILRFNLDTVGGVPWIPTTNPYTSTSAVWNIGIRNNQGFAYDSVTNILYGSSHGAYSDDEINIIQPYKNYGHPLVIGYAEGNYNGNVNPGTITSISAGSPWTDNNGNSTCPPIGSEATRVGEINAMGNGSYKAPIFSAYATPAATIANTWATNPGNANWLSEGWSGLDIYSNKVIPGWNRSLVAAGLKWGRLIRLKLGSTGLATLPSNLDSLNTTDTITYFQSTNRYRDLAFSHNGKDVFLVMDNSSATSGPGVGNPTVPACPGCVVKYSFLGYADAAGLSTIPKSIEVTNGAANTCNQGTQVTIDGTNNFLWVPITGPDGNIMAEINAMGQNLGLVTSSFYQNSGAIRVNGGVHYLDRNITITPEITSFVTPVKVRLYISKTEFDLLAADPLAAIGSIGQLKVLKNDDPCGPSIASSTTLLTPTNNLPADLQHGANGYVLQVNVSGFSSFYFGANNVALPLYLITFTGYLENNSATLLKWKTSNEINISHYLVERSADGQNFTQIGRVNAMGNTSAETNYDYKDFDVADLQSQNVFYRLKMFDKNAVYRYSNIVRVTLPGIQNVMTISPNPAITEVKASVTAAEDCEAEWQIIDAAGRVVLKNYISFKKGSNTLIINMSQLAAGTYYLAIKGNCIDLKSKFQKL